MDNDEVSSEMQNDFQAFPQYDYTFVYEKQAHVTARGRYIFNLLIVHRS